MTKKITLTQHTHHKRSIWERLARNPIAYLTKTAWRYAGPERPKMVIYGALSAIALAISLFEPLIIGRVMNSVQRVATSGNTDGFLRELAYSLAAYFGIGVVFWFFHGPSRVMERRTAFIIRRNFQMALFKIVTNLPLKWHRDTHSGATIDRITKATSALSDFCDGSFETIHMFVRFIGCLAILSVYMPVAGGVLIAATVAIISMVLLFDKVLVWTYEEINARYHHVAEAIHDYITNIKTVISLRLEESVSEEVLHRTGLVEPVLQKSILYNEVKWFLASALIALVTALVPFGYGYHVVSTHQALYAGTFFTLFDYLRRIGEAFFVFCFKYGDLVKQSTNVRAAEPLFTEAASLALTTKSASLPGNWKRIDVEELSFAHEDSDNSSFSLKGVTFSLEKGRSYAFIGESGSGKSTTLSLLRALYTPERVRVVCDGHEIPDGMHAIAHHTTLIPQDPEIFSVTIRENISMGLTVSDHDIAHAVRMAQCENVVRRLPKGLETSIAEKGVNLSGGEKQRLALARGFIFGQESDIVLLDEPTSSVDVVNERLIYENVLSTFKEKCIVSTIHKLYLLPMFDEICVFKEGQLVERGAFTELLAKDGAFSRLWESHHRELERESA